MEFFQSIWTALTTENELLTSIIFLPEVFIESVVNVLLFTTILNIKASFQEKKKYILFITLVIYITGFIPNPYRSFLNLLIILGSVHIFFKTTIVKTVLCAIIPILCSGICESMVLKFSTIFFRFDVTQLVSIPLYRFGLTMLVQLLVFFIYLIIKYTKIQISLLENMSKKNKTIFLLNFIVAIIAIIVQFLITGFYLNRLPIYIVLFSNISLIAYFLLSIYSLTRTTQLEIANLNLEQEKEHNRILKMVQDDLRGFRHDFANIMCTIGGYVHVKDIDGLTNYYSEIQKDISKVNNLGALDPSVINHPAIFTLIASKYDRATKENITMNINCFLDLTTLNMKIYEFTRVLGILLDNAIEAAKECNHKVIQLEIRKDTKRHRQLVIIENTYQEKEIDTEKIYEKNYSTKPGNTGLGLWEVRQILKRNQNLNLFTSVDNEYFKQQLEMYNQ